MTKPAASPVSRFVALELNVPELYPTPQGARLGLSGFNIGGDGLRELLASPNARFVTRLDLSNNGLSAADMQAFRNNSWNLVELNLAGNPIGDAGLEILLTTAAMTSLDSLDVSNADITDAGAKVLANERIGRPKRVMLGGVAVDIPTWKALALRYGEGLYARGAFNETSLSAIVSPTRRVALSFNPNKHARGWEDPGHCVDSSVRSILHYRLCDYAKCRIEKWADTQRPNRGSSFVMQNLGLMQEFEASLMVSLPGTQIVDKSGWGFELLREGVQPLALDCSACRKSYDQPLLRFEDVMDEGQRGACVKCPNGHAIYHEWSIP